MARCEDYPCCGHSLEEGCTPTTSPSENPELYWCQHHDEPVFHVVGELCPLVEAWGDFEDTDYDQDDVELDGYATYDFDYWGEPYDGDPGWD